MNAADLAQLVTDLTLLSLELNPQPSANPTGAVWQQDYPNIQGKGDDKKNQNYFMQLANQQQPVAAAAVQTASKPGPLEQQLIDYNTNLYNWRTGKSGPIDVRNMPGADVSIGLYNDAKTAHDAGRIGKGLGTLTEGANPNFAASLDKQNELERHLYAAGELEGNVNRTLDQNTAMMGGLAQTEGNRSMQIADLQQRQYLNSVNNYLDAAKSFRQPNFFRQLAMSFAGGAGAGLGAVAGG